MTALALALWVWLLAPPDGGAADGGAAAVTAEVDDRDGGRPGRDGGADDPDAEIVEHLDLLEQLELLERLELFEPQAPDGPGRAAPGPR